MGTLMGIAHFRFHPGGAERFQELSRRCLEVVRERDTGTLRYDIYLSPDGESAVVVEEYVDEAALVAHGEHLGEELSAAVLATGDVHGELLGDLSEDFRAGLAGGPVSPYRPWLSLEE